MSEPKHPYDGYMTMAYLLNRYGEPIFRGIPEDWTIEEREDFNIPNEVLVFRHPKNARIPIVWGNMGGDRWDANYGERTVIGLLLGLNP